MAQLCPLDVSHISGPECQVFSGLFDRTPPPPPTNPLFYRAINGSNMTYKMLITLILQSTLNKNPVPNRSSKTRQKTRFMVKKPAFLAAFRFKSIHHDHIQPGAQVSPLRPGTPPSAPQAARKTHRPRIRFSRFTASGATPKIPLQRSAQHSPYTSQFPVA
jgi:hypothetical protein